MGQRGNDPEVEVELPSDGNFKFQDGEIPVQLFIFSSELGIFSGSILKLGRGSRQLRSGVWKEILTVYWL